VTTFSIRHTFLSNLHSGYQTGPLSVLRSIVMARERVRLQHSGRAAMWDRRRPPALHVKLFAPHVEGRAAKAEQETCSSNL
jgi:hypothetical protein